MQKASKLRLIQGADQNQEEFHQIALTSGVSRKTAATIREYQKVILSARAVVDHYQPHLPVQPDCPMVPLGELCVIQSGDTPRRTEELYWNGSIPWVGPSVCQGGEVTLAEDFITEAGLNESYAKLFPKDSTLIALTGVEMGKTGLLKFESTTSQNIAGLYSKSKKILLPAYLFYAAQDLYAEIRIHGAGKWQKVPMPFIREYQIPLPPLAMQLAILAELEAERALVAANRQLIIRLEQKIQLALDSP